MEQDILEWGEEKRERADRGRAEFVLRLVGHFFKIDTRFFLQ